MISICIKENSNIIYDYLLKQIGKSSIPNMCYSKHSFKLYRNIIVHYSGNNCLDFYSFISTILSNAILAYYEAMLIKRILNTQFFYFEENDKKIIFDEYEILTKKMSESDFKNKFSYVYHPILEYIQNSKAIVIEGFVNFRLAKYFNLLEELVQESVNQYIIDKEYIEFVDLLKGYVDSKIPNDKKINLIYTNSEATLLAEDGNIIDLDSFNSIYLSDITFSNNDYVLNTLVGILPREIVLHLITPKDNFIKTIELIFGKKVKKCKGCELCNAYKILNLK